MLDMDKIFKICVNSLEWLAIKMHLSYEQINVILFVILMPLLFLTLIILLIIKW